MKYFLQSTSKILVLGEKYLHLYLDVRKKTVLLILKYKNLYFILALAIRKNVFHLYRKDVIVSLKFGILLTELERFLCFNSSHF